MSLLYPYVRGDLVAHALAYATKAHEGQVRKYTGEPYIVHPIDVLCILREYAPASQTTDEIYAAALLHDVVEDTPVTEQEIRNEFGDVVADYVRGMTKLELPEHNRAKRKFLEAQRLADCPSAVQTIKCADLLSNMKSIVEHDPKFAKVFMAETRVLHDKMDFAGLAIRELLDAELLEWEAENVSLI